MKRKGRKGKHSSKPAVPNLSMPDMRITHEEAEQFIAQWDILPQTDGSYIMSAKYADFGFTVGPDRKLQSVTDPRLKVDNGRCTIEYAELSPEDREAALRNAIEIVLFQQCLLRL